ncbi:hypothetical protein GKZ68_06065 [Hymenobacter sp. BRD128]|uniref:hypothetical protein n=1 Tax=Hymenobacter sp. BRD128 TaxID=2675878 RepID=UPI001564EB1A|nr:hypothetical protein [Hymenobacter sp. BRD128]QKG56246.1 hypothetical protein GKZ68_06065 [Hymenobacter sp. BRD128]
MRLARSLRTMGLLLASGWLGACSGAHESTQTATAVHAGAAPTTNVPALVGLSIDDLYSRLGAKQPLPVSLANAAEVLSAVNQATKQDSLATFKTGGLTLIANFNASTRQVRDLLLLGHHEDSLMARATLRSSATQYLVLPVFASNRPNYLLGLRIVPIN